MPLEVPLGHQEKGYHRKGSPRKVSFPRKHPAAVFLAGRPCYKKVKTEKPSEKPQQCWSKAEGSYVTESLSNNSVESVTQCFVTLCYTAVCYTLLQGGVLYSVTSWQAMDYINTLNIDRCVRNGVKKSLSCSKTRVGALYFVKGGVFEFEL